MPPCDTVVKRLLPCMFCECFKMSKLSTSEFGNMGMHRLMHAQDEFLTMVTEGVVHGVHKVVAWTYRGVIR